DADAAGDRPLAFLQGGPGWDIFNESTLAGLIKLGGGYRIALSPSIKLDFLLGWQFLYLQPKVYEEYPGGEIQIANEYLGRNNEWIGALTFGASLSF
ncbi:MAG: hypothetical protein MJY56_05355, partial [Bacteroidales bacterium]|nr:hypothetical protein [Bacteroidales bacterium]